MKKGFFFKLLIFSVIFIFLLLVATFYDYQISSFLAGKVLRDGHYFSNNIFGNIIEIVGESILYVFLTFSFIILAFYFYNKNRYFKFLTVFSYIVAFYFAYRIFNSMGKYIFEIYSLKIFKSVPFKILYIFLGLVYSFLNYLFIKGKFSQTINKLLPFALIVILTFALSTIITQVIIKPFMGRERFRTTYYLMSNNYDYLGFTKWYCFNGSSKSLASIYHVDKELYKSFPSGHTCAAAISFTLLILPKLYKNLSNKEKLFCYIFPFAYTITVAFGRMLVGAHYLSDVLVGGTITFICTYISFLIINLFKKKN